MKQDREHLTCPICGEKTLEEHGTEPGEHHWFFCRSCGAVIEQEEHEDGTALVARMEETDEDKRASN
jgi:transcription initiation factor TFIIIB Brf1 subunit/transcription initiation factor TFIIB